MARPRMPIGTWGEISVTPVRQGFDASCRFRDVDGVTRKVRRFGRTKGAARAALTAVLRERVTAAGVTEMTGSSLVPDVAQVWLSSASGLAMQTRSRYRDMIEGPITKHLREVSLQEATVTKLESVFALVTTESGPGTARLVRTVLAGTCALAVRRGAIGANPVRDTAPIAQAERDAVRALTLDEVEMIRRGCVAWEAGAAYKQLPAARRSGARRNSDMIDVVDVLLGTGARIGEVLALRWADVDLSAATVLVCGTIVRDEDSHLVRQPTPKSASSRRVLQLPSFSVDALMRRRVALTASSRLDLVFPSTTGGPRDPSNFRSVFRKIRAGVGLDWVTPHTFRKTVATLLDAEADLRTAAQQLGHSGTAVTARHYVERARIGPDMRKVLDALAPPRSLQ